MSTDQCAAARFVIVRWERLFGDLERQVAHIHASERDELAIELRDEDWSQTPWVATLGGHVELEVAGLGRVRGQVEHATELLVVLAGSSALTLVQPGAVIGVHRSESRMAPHTQVDQRTSFAIVLRSIRDQFIQVLAIRRDGQRFEGHIIAVGKDFFSLRLSETRRVTLPYRTVAIVSTID